MLEKRAVCIWASTEEERVGEGVCGIDLQSDSERTRRSSMKVWNRRRRDGSCGENSANWQLGRPCTSGVIRLQDSIAVGKTKRQNGDIRNPIRD